MNAKIIHRAYEDDFWKVRNLLIETYPLTPCDFNWEIRRWDGWNFHRENPQEVNEKCKNVHLWETGEGRLVGVAHSENGSGDAFLQLHPDYRELIEEEMIAWAEENLAVDGHVDFYVMEYDVPRMRLLEKRGYEKTPWWGMNRRMRFGNKPLPKVEIAEGYILRSTCPDDADHRRVADVLNAGFNRNIHTAAEFRHFTECSPSYRHDLNLVAEAPDGSFASLVGVTFEEVNRYGIFEPVCTHPNHLRKGLAKALMIEGLHRLRALGATDVYVGTGDMIAANSLYESIGFTEAYRGYYWRKVVS